MWCIGEHFFPRHGTQQLKRETCMMQRRVSNVFVAVVATFLLVLAAISPASADVGVRVAPRPSSTAPGTPSDTAKTASTLRNAQRRSTGSYTGSYRDAELLVDAPRYLVDAQPRVVKSRGVAFDGPDAALDPDDLEPDDLGSLVYGETQVNPKFRLPIQARIINGVEVFPEKKYRWMLGVVAVSSSGTESFRCGATLISPRYALSASHCYFSTGTTSNLGSSTIALKVGAHDIDEPEKTVEVIQIIGNPAYDGSTFENDITVLRLAEDLDIAEYPPVRLEWDPAKYDENQAARVIGWGTMEQGSGETSQVLMQADVPVVSQETCACPSSYPPGGTGLTVTDAMVCAGFADGGTDACQGDSGGPLVAVDANGDALSQLGIVSWGEGCAQAGKYGVYAHVNNLRGFLVRNVPELWKYSPNATDPTGQSVVLLEERRPEIFSTLREATRWQPLREVLRAAWVERLVEIPRDPRERT